MNLQPSFKTEHDRDLARTRFSETHLSPYTFFLLGEPGALVVCALRGLPVAEPATGKAASSVILSDVFEELGTSPGREG